MITGIEVILCFPEQHFVLANGTFHQADNLLPNSCVFLCLVENLSSELLLQIQGLKFQTNLWLDMLLTITSTLGT